MHTAAGGLHELQFQASRACGGQQRLGPGLRAARADGGAGRGPGRALQGTVRVTVDRSIEEGGRGAAVVRLRSPGLPLAGPVLGQGRRAAGRRGGGG